MRDMVSGTLGLVLTGEIFGALLFRVPKFSSEVALRRLRARSFDARPGVAFLFVVSLGAALWPAWSAAGRDPSRRFG